MIVHARVRNVPCCNGTASTTKYLSVVWNKGENPEAIQRKLEGAAIAEGCSGLPIEIDALHQEDTVIVGGVAQSAIYERLTKS